MIRILNKSLQTVAILENAYGIGYERKLNELWTARFALPIDDPKNAHCKPLNFVEITDDNTGEYIGLFRIVPANTRKLATINEVRYELEHVLATLLNDVLFRYHQRSNHTTRSNIEYVLSHQTTKHWRLGDCDFTRYFHYKWENENGLLGPLFSIPEPFDVPYVWTWDTRSYPWTLNLKSPDNAITAEVRYGKNLAEIERTVDPTNIINRIYPLGYGEGVNQLDITKINNGVPYIENTASINEYGLGQYVWVDRRFEDVDSLLASARAFLDEWSLPKVSYRIKAVDLSSLTGVPIDKLTCGKVVRIIDPDIGTFNARIVSESKPDMVEEPYNVELEIVNTRSNIGTTIADIERRQEINEVYSQGATNLLVYPYEDNADAQHPAVIRFKLPDEMVRINKLELTYETTEFRAYSRAIEGGGAYVKGSVVQSKSTSAGGGTTATSSNGGGVSKSTAAGGSSTQTSEQMDDEAWYIAVEYATAEPGVPHTHTIPMPFVAHRHKVNIPSHTHNFEVPEHKHSVTIQPHTHDFEVEIPAIDIPEHTHELEHGIFKLDRMPTAVSIKVDGNTVPISALNGDSIDLIPYLSLDDQNRVQRGWHTVEITPNDFGRINAQLMVQFFMQSRGGVDA